MALREYKTLGVSSDWIEVTLVLQRRTMFYILNNILPVVFLSFLNTFAFLLPEESGEKISLCVSILLSYAMFLTLINSYLPANSDHLCFFSVYVTLLVLISTLTCLVTIFMFVLNTRLQRGKVCPRWLPLAWGSDSKVGTTEPRVEIEDVAPNQSDDKEKANKTTDMKDLIMTRCNKAGESRSVAARVFNEQGYEIGFNNMGQHVIGQGRDDQECFFILLLCHLTIGSVSYKEKEFLANLTLNYDPKIRPVLDGSKTIVASIALQKFKIYNASNEWIEVTLVLQRRPMFYILNNILPVVFLSFLNTFAFLLPEESGEKMSLCVSILLSYAMFLTLINSYLPANSDHLCFFSVYVTLLVLISTLTCLVTIFMLILHTHLQRGMASPRWLPIAWGSDSKVGTTEPRVKNDDVAPYQSDVKDKDKDKANKKLDMKDAIITKCNKVAFGTFFTLTILVNLIFFICVSL
ncbi:uncharacterized protein [Haliotis cracherodii]|uniref:uncharacterized protein n=1 Tax=Haliotis cracherodii TaxID=6455 RepID=UPI0039ED6BE4